MSKNTEVLKNQLDRADSPLKRMRLNVKLTQDQLAKRLGVAVSTIRRWEKKQAEPTMTVAQMRKFCQAVERDLEDLPDSLLSMDD